MKIKSREHLPQITSADNYSLLLKEIADELLSHQADNKRLSAAATRLYSLCSAITGIDDDSNHEADASGIRLQSGEAISPMDAARCILDFNRTSQFMKGLYAAILEAQKRFPNTVIEILYAGCGPFAPLAIALTSRFDSSEINFTLLDIHQRSLDSAHHIFQSLGKRAYVRDYIQCDAAFYKHDAARIIHLVVAEAMQNALEKEPQAAITLSLAPQLCPGGIFLPERITVDCYLCDLTKEFLISAVEFSSANSSSFGKSARVRINLGRVFELTANSSLSASGNNEGHPRASFPPKFVKVPDDADGDLHLMLLTGICIFGTASLSEYESGLTCPKILYDAGKMHLGKVIKFEYLLGDKPGLKYSSL